MTRNVLWCFVFAALLGAVRMSAQTGKVLRQGLVYPCFRATSAIVIDGDLGDAAWQQAPLVSGFRDSGKEVLFPEPMAMQLLWDEQNVYLAITCYESKMKSLVTNVTIHDGPFWDDDCIELFFDPQHLHADIYQLAVTAKAATFDSWKGDRLWSKPWQAKTKLHEDRWCVEIAIPITTLQMDKISAGDFWGFNLCRERMAGGQRELANWADVGRVFNTPELFGHLFFAEAGWKPASNDLAKLAAKAAGTEENIVYLTEGMWVFSKDGTSKFNSYAAEARELFDKLPDRVVELQKIFAVHANFPHAGEFARWTKDFAEWRKLIYGQAQLDGVTLSRAVLFRNLYQTHVEKFYWETKLTQLNAEMP